LEKETKNVWLEALKVIKTEVSQQVFQMWFQSIEMVSCEENLINLRAPNKFIKDWVLEHYEELIKSALEKTARKNLRLIFFVKDADGKSAVAQKKETGRPYPGLNPKYSFSSFVVGESNRFAHAAALAVAESPAKAYNPLFIYGGVGLGKTHLMQSIGRHILGKNPGVKAVYISAERFANQLIDAIQNRTTANFREKYRNVDVLLIDDVHFLAGKESTQEAFFHTFNVLYDANKQVVISSDRSPKEIPMIEERLVSRFGWGLVTDIQPPNLETRVAILKKKAEGETILLSDEIAFFLASKIETNVRELEGALIRVIAYASLMGARIDIKLVEDVLKDSLLKEREEKKITIDLIQKKVAEYFDLRISDMKTKQRSRTVAYPRQIAMYLTRNLTDFSLPETGEYFGGRDHTTVIYACDKIQKELKKKPGMRVLINKLIKDIKG